MRSLTEAMMPLGPAAPQGSGGSMPPVVGMPSQEAEMVVRGPPGVEGEERVSGEGVRGILVALAWGRGAAEGCGAEAPWMAGRPCVRGREKACRALVESGEAAEEWRGR